MAFFVAWIFRGDDTLLGLSGLALAGWGASLFAGIGRDARVLTLVHESARIGPLTSPKVHGGTLVAVGIVMATAGFAEWL